MHDGVTNSEEKDVASINIACAFCLQVSVVTVK